MKHFNFFHFLLIFCIKSSFTFNIECKYTNDWSFYRIGNIYYCNVQNDLIWESESGPIDISYATGSLLQGKSRADVLGFTAVDKQAKYFPNGINKIFQNLILIYIEQCHLEEVHQADLKPFSKLKSLSLENNKIQIVENGLFDFNPQLEIIWLNGNKIFHIGENALKVQGSPTWVFKANDCIDMETDENIEDLQKLLNHVKYYCQDVNVISVEKILENLESKNESLSEFRKELEDAENEFLVSRFRNLESFKKRFNEISSKM